MGAPKCSYIHLLEQQLKPMELLNSCQPHRVSFPMCLFRKNMSCWYICPRRMHIGFVGYWVDIFNQYQPTTKLDEISIFFKYIIIYDIYS
jgi:hypothetical protein